MQFAYQMSLSIRYFSQIPIQLITNLEVKGDYDYITRIEDEDCYIMEKRHNIIKKQLNPGFAKLSLDKYIIFDEAIYLDVDGILLKPIEPLFEECTGQYHSQVMGWGGKGEEGYNAMVWAWPKDIWGNFAIKETARIPFINSSFQFIRKGDITKRLFEQARINMRNPIKLRSKWGSTQPDELYMNIALAQQGLDPSTKTLPVYFSDKRCDSEQYLMENHYILGLYGGKQHTHRSVCDYYDRKLKSLGIKSISANQLIKEKWMVRRGK